MARRRYSGLSELAKAAIHRRRDARRLFNPSDRYPGDALHRRGAVYLAGYAIECKLKCVAMEVHDCWSLEQLIERRGLDERQVFSHGLEVLATHVPALWSRFQRSDVWNEFRCLINRWRPSWRYSPRPMSEHDTRRFLQAVDRMSAWLEHNRG